MQTVAWVWISANETRQLRSRQAKPAQIEIGWDHSPILSPAPQVCGDSVSPVRNCSSFQPLTSGRARAASLCRQPSMCPAERAFTYLVDTELNGRSVSTSGPSRMTLGRRTALGNCMHYWMSRLQWRDNKQKNELKGVICSRHPDGRVDGNMEEQALLYNHIGDPTVNRIRPLLFWQPGVSNCRHTTRTPFLSCENSTSDFLVPLTLSPLLYNHIGDLVETYSQPSASLLFSQSNKTTVQNHWFWASPG